MPVSYVYLDSSIRKENITVVLGKNILLKLVEDSDKQALLRNILVKKFVSIPDLCNDEVRSLINRLVEREATLTAPTFVQTLFQEKEKIESVEPLLECFERIFAPIKESKFAKAIERKTSEEATCFKELFEQEDLLADLMLRVGKIDKTRLPEYEKELLAINKKIMEKTGIKILVPSTLFICPECQIILGSPKVALKKCYSCKREMNEENAERIPIYRVPDEIKKVWQSNFWFEAYFAGLLRKLGFKTWPSVHAMGASGILHEIDVLAIRKGTVLVCECKTGKVSRNDVFNFCTKVGDLKAHVSILALTGELPEPETREFVKKNPAIIRLENMGKKKEVDILNDLEHRLKIKAEP